MKIFKAIVIGERSAGDSGRYIDLLTENNSLCEVFVRGSKKDGANGTALTQLFSYAEFCIRASKGSLYFDSAAPIRIFYRLREKLSRLRMAMYCIRVIRGAYDPEQEQRRRRPGDVLRLLLNTLHFLEKGTYSDQFLCTVFELRLMTELGMMPDLLICLHCGCFEPPLAMFSPQRGRYLCSTCVEAAEKSPEEQFMPLSLPALRAMRHIVFADYERLWNFRLPQRAMAELSAVTRAFMNYHLDLDYSEILRPAGGTDL